MKPVDPEHLGFRTGAVSNLNAEAGILVPSMVSRAVSLSIFVEDTLLLVALRTVVFPLKK